MDNRSIYMSAEALGIQPEERQALIDLIRPLSNNEIQIDMKYFYPQDSTNRNVCIGGNVFNMTGTRHYSEPLRDLYLPTRLTGYRQGDAHNPYDATSSQAAEAIVNFLTLKDPRWPAIMGDPAA